MSTERLTVEEYRALVARGNAPSKYRNRKIEYGGRLYDSALEARHAAALDQHVKAGLIRAWLPQVSFPLPGVTNRIRIDFMVIENDGSVRFQDTKGPRPTKDWAIKRQLFENATGFRIELIERA